MGNKPIWTSSPVHWSVVHSKAKQISPNQWQLAEPARPNVPLFVASPVLTRGCYRWRLTIRFLNQFRYISIGVVSSNAAAGNATGHRTAAAVGWGFDLGEGNLVTHFINGTEESKHLCDPLSTAIPAITCWICIDLAKRSMSMLIGNRSFRNFAMNIPSGVSPAVRLDATTAADVTISDLQLTTDDINNEPWFGMMGSSSSQPIVDVQLPFPAGLVAPGATALGTVSSTSSSSTSPTLTSSQPGAELAPLPAIQVTTVQPLISNNLVSMSTSTLSYASPSSLPSLSGSIKLDKVNTSHGHEWQTVMYPGHVVRAPSNALCWYHCHTKAEIDAKNPCIVTLADRDGMASNVLPTFLANKWMATGRHEWTIRVTFRSSHQSLAVGVTSSMILHSGVGRKNVNGEANIGWAVDIGDGTWTSHMLPTPEEHCQPITQRPTHAIPTPVGTAATPAVASPSPSSSSMVSSTMATYTIRCVLDCQRRTLELYYQHKLLGRTIQNIVFPVTPAVAFDSQSTGVVEILDYAVNNEIPSALKWARKPDVALISKDSNTVEVKCPIAAPSLSSGNGSISSSISPTFIANQVWIKGCHRWFVYIRFTSEANSFSVGVVPYRENDGKSAITDRDDTLRTTEHGIGKEYRSSAPMITENSDGSVYARRMIWSDGWSINIGTGHKEGVTTSSTSFCKPLVYGGIGNACMVECSLDLDHKTFTVYHNGQWIGVAFTEIQGPVCAAACFDEYTTGDVTIISYTSSLDCKDFPYCDSIYWSSALPLQETGPLITFSVCDKAHRSGDDRSPTESYFAAYSLLFGVNSLHQQDEKLALRYLERAVRSSVPGASSLLAVCYIEGRGCEKDVKKGLSLLQKCEDCYAQMDFGIYHSKRDSQVAQRALQVAAAHGLAVAAAKEDIRAMVSIAHCYSIDNYAFPRDPQRQMEYLAKPNRIGHTYAQELLEKLKGLASPDQPLARAQPIVLSDIANILVASDIKVHDTYPGHFMIHYEGGTSLKVALDQAAHWVTISCSYGVAAEDAYDEIIEMISTYNQQIFGGLIYNPDEKLVQYRQTFDISLVPLAALRSSFMACWGASRSAAFKYGPMIQGVMNGMPLDEAKLLIKEDKSSRKSDRKKKDDRLMDKLWARVNDTRAGGVQGAAGDNMRAGPIAQQQGPVAVVPKRDPPFANKQ